MKSIDFTQPGGFPLTQDQLGYLQAGYTECLNALAAMGGSGPFTVNGCSVTKTPVSGTIYNYAVTAGWVFYEGNLIKVSASTLTGIDESVDAAYMLITQSATSLVYNNGSTPNVVLDAGITLVAQAIGTADDSSHFLLSEVIHNGFMPLPTHTTVMAAPAGQTVSFTRPQYILYNSVAAPGTSTIALDSTNAKEGCEVVLHIVCNPAGTTINFSLHGFDSVVPLTGTPSLSSGTISAPLIVKIKVVNTGGATYFLVQAYNNS